MIETRIFLLADTEEVQNRIRNLILKEGKKYNVEKLSFLPGEKSPKIICKTKKWLVFAYGEGKFVITIDGESVPIGFSTKEKKVIEINSGQDYFLEAVTPFSCEIICETIRS